MAPPRRDLVERSLAFASRLLAQIENWRRSGRVEPVVLDQLTKAGTSIGAHNAEAESAISRRHLLTLRSGALREAREAQYWLAIAARRMPTTHEDPDTAWLYREVSELVAILTTIVKHLGGTSGPSSRGRS